MTGWLILGGYIAGWLFTTWYIAPLLAESSAYGEPDFEDRVMGTVMGLLIAIFWPLALLVVLAAKHHRKTPRQMGREAEAQARRIADLERELLRRDGAA